MEGKRYSFLGSFRELINSMVKNGSTDDGRVSEKSSKLDSKSKALLDSLTKKRDEFAKKLLSNLNSGGSSAGMDLAVQIEEKAEKQQEQIKDESKEKSDGFEIAD